MNEYSMLAAIVASIALVAAIIGYQTNATDQEAAKAGLQQCIVGNNTVWQKECAK